MIGPPRSGKTSSLVARASERYRIDPFAKTLILVPTVRHADQIRRRLVNECGVAFQLRVATMQQFSSDILEPSATVTTDVAEELLRKTILEATHDGTATYFEPIASTEGLQRLVASAIRELLHEQVDAATFLNATGQTGDLSLQALGAIFSSYAHELNDREWRHPAELGRVRVQDAPT